MFAAAGDWGRAAEWARANFPAPARGEVWDESVLTEFIASLAPWEQNPRITAEALLDTRSRLPGGELTVQRCVTAAEEWAWLADRVWYPAALPQEIVHAAGIWLNRWRLTQYELDSFLCLTTGTAHDQAHLAAAEMYRRVQLGLYTPDRAVIDLFDVIELLPLQSASPTAVPGDGDEGGSSPAPPDNAPRADDAHAGRSTPSPAGRRSGRQPVPDPVAPEEAESRPEPDEAAAALEVLRRDAGDILSLNKARYRWSKNDPGSRIHFAVYGGGSPRPVLVLEGIDVPSGAASTYEGWLRVSQQAGGVGAKVGRFLKARGSDRFSAGTVAGVITVEATSGVLDLRELDKLVRKSGVTDKKLIEQTD
ncbi:hypothetical protein [Streptomyces sp. NPDC051014]|uniref:hypothetical protein n=1 Tax=Streptomyces sp. NPDC051014 TaxID=3155751 RepID=UPI003404A03A